MTPHPDDLSLLLQVRGALDEVTRARVLAHVAGCTICGEAIAELRQIDEGLSEIAPQLANEDAGDLVFPPRDPFRERPRPAVRPGHPDPALSRRALAASLAAEEIASRLVAAAAEEKDTIPGHLQAILLARPEERVALEYALDEALERMVERPARWLSFGRAAAARIRAEIPAGGGDAVEAESLCPLPEVDGVASLVVGSACNWTGAYSEGGRALAHAYRAFAAGLGLSPRFAQVELAESQRRTFLGRPAEGLRLANRAAEAFEEYGLEAHAARARGARALAFSYLGRDEEAVAEFRGAREAFERQGQWNAWVSALNGAGSSLMRLGRIEEARREYARALRRVSRTERPAVHAFIRSNLAKILLAAGRVEDAARGFSSAASLFLEQGAVVDALTALLGEVDARARAGQTAAARRAFGRFRATLEREGAADALLVSSLETALAADRCDLALLETLREQAEVSLRDGSALIRTRPLRDRPLYQNRPPGGA